jgi:hypothetical protein
MAGTKDVAVNVPVNPVKSKFKQTIPKPDTVTVFAPELASKKALSADVGTLAPLAPPELADQFAVLEAFQLLVPPTQ